MPKYTSEQLASNLRKAVCVGDDENNNNNNNNNNNTPALSEAQKNAFNKLHALQIWMRAQNNCNSDIKPNDGVISYTELQAALNLIIAVLYQGQDVAGGIKATLRNADIDQETYKALLLPSESNQHKIINFFDNFILIIINNITSLLLFN